MSESVISRSISFARQMYNEMLKMAARKRSHIGFATFLVVQVLILLLLRLPGPRSRFERLLAGFGILAPQDYLGGMTLAIVIIALSTLVAALYIALVCGDIVAKEIEDGTMRMIMARPVGRLRLMVIKWSTGAAYSFALMLFLGVSALTISTVYMGTPGKLWVFVPPERINAFYDTGEGLWRYAVAIAALSYSSLVIASMAFMFSCYRMKPATATILTLSVLFADMVMRNLQFFEPIKELFINYHSASWVRTLRDEPDWGAIALSWAFLAIINAVCFAVGAIRFCGRDFKT